MHQRKTTFHRKAFSATFHGSTDHFEKYVRSRTKDSTRGEYLYTVQCTAVYTGLVWKPTQLQFAVFEFFQEFSTDNEATNSVYGAHSWMME